jgi:Na+-driven multidrug efflux pump
VPTITLEEIGRLHRDYARSSLPAFVIYWAYTNLFLFVLPLGGDLGDTGALRVLILLLGPFYQLFSALSVALIPRVASAPPAEVGKELAAHLRRTSALAVGSYVCYVGLCFIAMPTIFAHKYDAYIGYSWWLGVWLLFENVAISIANALRGLNDPSAVLRLYSKVTLPVLVPALSAAVLFGLAGAVGGMLAVSGVTALGFWTLYRRSPRLQETGA